MDSNGRVATALSYCGTMFGLGMVLEALGPSLLGLARQTHSPLQALSMVFTMRSVGYLVGTIIGGNAVDRFTGNNVLAVALLVAGAASFAVPLVENLIVLGLWISMQGVAMGVLDAGGNTLLLWLFADQPEGAVDSWMQAMHFAFALGAVVAPLALRASLDFGGGYGGVWFLAAAWLTLSALAVAFRPSPPKRDVSSPSESASADKRGIVWCGAVLLGLYVGCETGFGGFVMVYAHLQQGLTEATGQYMAAAFWAAIAFGRLAAVWLTYFTPKQLMTGNLVFSLAGIWLVLLVPDSPSVLWVSCILYGLGMASIFPTMFTLLERYTPISGSDSTLVVAGAAIGEMMLPVTIGYTMTDSTPLSFVWLLFGGTFGMAGVFGILLRFGSRLEVKEKEAKGYGGC